MSIRKIPGDPSSLFHSLDQSKRDLNLHMLPGELLSDEDVADAKWYDCMPDWPDSVSSDTSYTLEQWAHVAEDALVAVSRAFERKIGSSEEAKQKKLGKEKTTGDKIAAVTLMVQESPVHRMDELRTLLGFAKKKGRRERGLALETLKDLFINDLLPKNRRLVPMEAREYRAPRIQISKRLLAYAMFESELKKIYQDFLTVVDECSRDTILHFKEKSLRICFDLLVESPEQERTLLAMLVNGLGAPDRRVAATASHYLTLLTSRHHPAMKIIVVREVESFVHRANVGMRAKYYAVLFLSQMRFSSLTDVQLARALVRIYMDLFAECVEADRSLVKSKESGGVETKDSRLMGALLTGINRAFPYSQPDKDDSDYSSQCEALFRVAHARSITSATQALSFLFQVAQANSTVSDRFYRALYCRIPDAAVASESKQALFLNLLMKAVKADVSSKRIKAFSKRILQTSLQSSPGFAASSLLMLSSALLKRNRGLFKSFVLLAECDDDEEMFRDFVDVSIPNGQKSVDEADNESSDVNEATTDADLNAMESTIVRDKDLNQNEVVSKSSIVFGSGYEPLKREPTFANAEQSCLWEIVALCCHYHPSVVAFGERLRSGMSDIVYDGDPLKDFTAGAFLEKFCYKKPKKSILQTLHGRRSSQPTEKPILNSEQFVKLGDSGLVSEDDKFFLRFFKTNPSRIQKQGDSDPASEVLVNDSDGEISGAESEEEAFESALREEMKRLGGGVTPDLDSDSADNMNPDELRAFDTVFHGDMGHARSDSDVEHPNIDDENIDDTDSIPAHSKEGGTRKQTKVTSVFAPVDDYASQLDSEVVNELHELESDGSIDRESKSRPSKRKRDKRRGSDLGNSAHSRKHHRRNMAQLRV